MSDAIRRIQRALQGKGYDPGEIDGIWGRRTVAAVRTFQQANGLKVDGIVGKNTADALMDGGQAAAPTLPIVWFEEARRQFGTREVPGPASNLTLLDWAGDLGIPYGSDDIPWCGLFVAHCIGSTLPEEILPRSPLSARGWKSFGRATEPRRGAIMMFWRGSRDGPLGHVAFYAGEDDDAYHVVGGNQSDSVSVARIAKDRLLDARWPSTAAALASGRVQVAAGASALSVNEA